MESQGGQGAVRIVVSGSFHRHLEGIADVVHEMADLGGDVLSPADPRIVDAFGDFLFVASDVQRSIRVVQSRHLQAIAMADFVWLVCPDGYVGSSAAMEVGFGVALGKKIFTTTPPSDLTLRQYVTVVATLVEAIRQTSSSRKTSAEVLLLVDPAPAIELAHRQLDRLGPALLLPRSRDELPAIRRAVGELESLLTLP